ncbi:hypothetical protein MXB_2101 [Myxobolus squamalis]|nr:hypothetical protein MXB_2101 [Myxobolus squamalis]
MKTPVSLSQRNLASIILFTFQCMPG